MQAQDRAYRYGQVNTVGVYRLISQGTVEEMIYMRQLYKQRLQQAILAEKKCGGNGSDLIEEVEVNFEGIEGDSSCRGELFGMENILQYHEGSILQNLREKYRTEDAVAEILQSKGGDNDSGLARKKSATVLSTKRSAERPTLPPKKICKPITAEQGCSHSEHNLGARKTNRAHIEKDESNIGSLSVRTINSKPKLNLYRPSYLPSPEVPLSQNSRPQSDVSSLPS
jgi:hypothetical protein